MKTADFAPEDLEINALAPQEMRDNHVNHVLTLTTQQFDEGQIKPDIRVGDLILIKYEGRKYSDQFTQIFDNVYHVNAMEKLENIECQS